MMRGQRKYWRFSQRGTPEKFRGAPRQIHDIIGDLPAITRYNSHFARSLAETRGTPRQNFAGADASAATPLPIIRQPDLRGNLFSGKTVTRSTHK